MKMSKVQLVCILSCTMYISLSVFTSTSRQHCQLLLLITLIKKTTGEWDRQAKTAKQALPQNMNYRGRYKIRHVVREL